MKSKSKDYAKYFIVLIVWLFMFFASLSKILGFGTINFWAVFYSLLIATFITLLGIAFYGGLKSFFRDD